MATLATETQELIPGLCRQFTQVTGWRLLFSSIHGDDSGLTADQLANDPNCCWFAEINDGQDLNGFLHLEAPEFDSNLSFLQVTDLAEMLARLLGKVATATRRVESRNRDVSTLVNLGMAVPARDNLPWALNQLLKASVQLTASRGAAFFLLAPTTETLKLRAVYQVPAEQVPEPNRQLAKSHYDLSALATGPVVICNADAAVTWLPPTVKSALCVAVESETVPIGTLWIYDRRERVFHERDVHVAQSIAAQIAVVLERIALLRENQTQDRIARELRAASESQPSLTRHTLPEDPRYEIAAHLVSCYELGGDLCELIPLPNDQIAIGIGDACGNSIPAAMIMSAVRGALRTHPANEQEVVSIMEKLNHALYSITQSHQFMSLCYGVFEPERRRFTYSNAGHPVPILVRGGEAIPLQSHGLLLGVLREVTYSTSVLELQPNDLLVFYSDGISEARSGQQQMFRSEGIASAALHSHAESAAEILQSIWSKVEHHIAGGEPADDRTLLVLKVR